MKKTRRLRQSHEPARKRTSRVLEVLPHEPLSARMSWRAARVRGAVVHALAHARERASSRAGDLKRRAASARAHLAWGLKRGTASTSELARPALVSIGVAGLAFWLFGNAWSAFGAGGWTFAIVLLLALRAAQQRHAQAVYQELYELKHQLHGELHELRQQLQFARAVIQVDELEDVEEVDLSDEPTRAGPVPKRLGWGKRLGLHWPSWR